MRQTDHKDFFLNNHYFLHKGPVFSEQSFAEIKSYFYDYIKKVPEPLRYLNCANDPQYKPAIRDFVDRKEILDIVKPIMGDGLIFWSIGVCYKPPQSNFEVGWHIDSHCWMRDKVIYPPEALVLFLSLTDMTIENGALQIVPQLNEAKFYNHDKRDKDKFFFEFEITEEELSGREQKFVEMKENQIMGFASHVPHRSLGNKTDKERFGITLRYLRSDVHITGTPLDGRDSYLISGTDLAGNKYADIKNQKSILKIS